MRSHYIRGNPGASRTQVERSFESLLPEDVTAYVRVLKPEELTSDPHGVVHYGAFHAGGEMTGYDTHRLSLVARLEAYALQVHSVH